MTREEYQLICDQLARKAIQYGAQKIGDEVIESVEELNARASHWIDVFLDEYLPDIDTDVLLDVTSHTDAFEKSAGRAAPSRTVAAFHAFQADVWDAINRMEETAGPADEQTVARGMLSRYSSPKVAIEMAHWHAMDHAEGSEGRSRWQRVKETIARLSKKGGQ